MGSQQKVPLRLHILRNDRICRQSHDRKGRALIRVCCLILLSSGCAAFAQQQEMGQLDASPTLFTVMAAINAAGYDAQLDSPNNHPLRKAIRDELAKKKLNGREVRGFLCGSLLQTDPVVVGSDLWSRRRVSYDEID